MDCVCMYSLRLSFDLYSYHLQRRHHLNLHLLLRQ